MLPSCDGCWVTRRVGLLWSQSLPLSTTADGHAEPRLSREAGADGAFSPLIMSHILTGCPVSHSPSLKSHTRSHTRVSPPLTVQDTHILWTPHEPPVIHRSERSLYRRPAQYVSNTHPITCKPQTTHPHFITLHTNNPTQVPPMRHTHHTPNTHHAPSMHFTPLPPHAPHPPAPSPPRSPHTPSALSHATPTHHFPSRSNQGRTRQASL